MPVGNLVTEIASVIHQNARDGVVDWQTVTEWALAQILEGQCGQN